MENPGRKISMIFQEPMTSLNPSLTIGNADRRMLPGHMGYAKVARDCTENC